MAILSLETSAARAITSNPHSLLSWGIMAGAMGQRGFLTYTILRYTIRSASNRSLLFSSGAIAAISQGGALIRQFMDPKILSFITRKGDSRRKGRRRKHNDEQEFYSTNDDVTINIDDNIIHIEDDDIPTTKSDDEPDVEFFIG